MDKMYDESEPKGTEIQENTIVKIAYDSVRAINSWFIYEDEKHETLMDGLVQAHLDIHDIFIAPTACFIIFPIDYEPIRGKVYKDMYLLHPDDLQGKELPYVVCVNDGILDTCFPSKEEMKKERIKSENLNQIRYLNILGDHGFIEKNYIEQNYHLVGVYNNDWLPLL